jgi:hypothetical protein
MKLETLEKIRIAVMLFLCILVAWVGYGTFFYNLELVRMQKCNIDMITSPVYCSTFCNASTEVVYENCSCPSKDIYINITSVACPSNPGQIWTLFGYYNLT